MLQVLAALVDGQPGVHPLPVVAGDGADDNVGTRRQICNGCGECVQYCPVRAIVPAEEFASRQRHTRKAELGRILGV